MFRAPRRGHPDDMNISLTSVQNDVTERLDDLEESLPSIPSKGLNLTRASARRVIDTSADVVCTVRRAADSVWNTAATSTRTSVGQASSAVSRTAKTASDAARQTAGQVRAETAQTVDAATQATERLLDEGALAIDADRPNPGVPYGQWTKAQLYDRAQELDLDGRSSMTKKQLVAALGSA